jgi:hypothetical protein
MEEAERQLKRNTGFIIWEGTLRREPPAREQEPTAAYRLGVDTEEQAGGETLPGGNVLLE